MAPQFFKPIINNIMEKINIYTDGRHAKGDKHDVTYGICMVTKDKMVKTHSGALDTEAFYNQFQVYVSNPTAELYAAAKVLEIFKEAKNVEIIIHSDYVGVQKWINREWKAKKEYIRVLLQYIDSYMAKLYNNNSVVEFQWIKGHSGHEFNDLADSLCKVKAHDELKDWVNRHNLEQNKKSKFQNPQHA